MLQKYAVLHGRSEIVLPPEQPEPRQCVGETPGTVRIWTATMTVLDVNGADRRAINRKIDDRAI